MSEQQKPKCLPKLPTGIRGLDKVLYGGIDANVLNPLYIKEQTIERTPLVIVIRGNEDDNDKLYRTSFGKVQLLFLAVLDVWKVGAGFGAVLDGI